MTLLHYTVKAITKSGSYPTGHLRDKERRIQLAVRQTKRNSAVWISCGFLICHDSVPEEPHLHVVRPLTSVSLPELSEQEFASRSAGDRSGVYEGGYDRIVCSTGRPDDARRADTQRDVQCAGLLLHATRTGWTLSSTPPTLITTSGTEVRRLLRWIYPAIRGSLCAQ